MHPSPNRPRPAAARRWASRCALAAAVLVAGCAQNTPYERPAAPVPMRWAGTAVPVDAAQARAIQWRSYFPDPRLQSLIAAALVHNRDLRIAAGRVLEARAQYGLARAERLPQVNLLGSADVTRTPSSVTNGDPPLSRRLDVTLSSLSFELDFWGRLERLTDAARASYLATEEARRAVRLSLVADVASAWFQLLQADEMLRFSQSTVELRQQSLELVSQGRDIGATDDYVYQQARGSLEEAQTTLAAWQHQHQTRLNQLHYLVGNAPIDMPVGASLDSQGFDARLSPGVPSEVLLLRPDVVAAEQRLIAAHANIDAIRAAFLPRILLTAGLGFASQGLVGLFSRGAWMFQPSITLPLFDGGRNEANLDLAKAREVIAVAEYEKTIQQAFREVADLLSARESLVLQARASQANLEAQQQRLQIARARFTAGAVGYLEVLDAQRQLVAAAQGTTQIRRAQLDAAAQLYKALGGGEGAPADGA